MWYLCVFFQEAAMLTSIRKCSVPPWAAFLGRQSFGCHRAKETPTTPSKWRRSSGVQGCLCGLPVSAVFVWCGHTNSHAFVLHPSVPAPRIVQEGGNLTLCDKILYFYIFVHSRAWLKTLVKPLLHFVAGRQRRTTPTYVVLSVGIPYNTWVVTKETFTHHCSDSCHPVCNQQKRSFTWIFICLLLARAPLGYSAICATLGGGGRFCALANFRTVALVV